MPYKNILWIKLEKRLLNDYRFYTLSEEAQLIFVKLLMLSAETINKIPKNPQVLKSCMRSYLTPEKIEKCLEEIQKNFPKFKNKANFYYFQEWDYKHNVIPKEIPRNSQGTPWDAVEENRIDKIRREESKSSSSKKLKPYYDGNEMRKDKANKWWVIPKEGGQWLEFAGKISEIEYK